MEQKNAGTYDGICTQCLIETGEEIAAIAQRRDGSCTLYLCEKHAGRAHRRKQEQKTRDMLSLLVSVVSILAAFALSVSVGNVVGAVLIAVVIGGCIAACVWLLKFGQRIRV